MIYSERTFKKKALNRIDSRRSKLNTELIPFCLRRRPRIYAYSVGRQKWTWKLIDIVVNADVSQYLRIHRRLITDPKHIMRVVDYEPQFIMRVKKHLITQRIANIAMDRWKNAIAHIPARFVTYETAVECVRRSNRTILYLDPSFLTREVITIALKGFNGVPYFMIQKKLMNAIIDKYPESFKLIDQRENLIKPHRMGARKEKNINNGARKDNAISLEEYISGLNKLGGSMKYNTIYCD